MRRTTGATITAAACALLLLAGCTSGGGTTHSADPPTSPASHSPSPTPTPPPPWTRLPAPSSLGKTPDAGVSLPAIATDDDNRKPVLAWSKDTLYYLAVTSGSPPKYQLKKIDLTKSELTPESIGQPFKRIGGAVPTLRVIGDTAVAVIWPDSPNRAKTRVTTVTSNGAVSTHRYKRPSSEKGIVGLGPVLRVQYSVPYTDHPVDHFPGYILHLDGSRTKWTAPNLDKVVSKEKTPFGTATPHVATYMFGVVNHVPIFGFQQSYATYGDGAQTTLCGPKGEPCVFGFGTTGPNPWTTADIRTPKNAPKGAAKHAYFFGASRKYVIGGWGADETTRVVGAVRTSTGQITAADSCKGKVSTPQPFTPLWLRAAESPDGTIIAVHSVGIDVSTDTVTCFNGADAAEATFTAINNDGTAYGVAAGYVNPKKPVPQRQVIRVNLTKPHPKLVHGSGKRKVYLPSLFVPRGAIVLGKVGAQWQVARFGL